MPSRRPSFFLPILLFTAVLVLSGCAPYPPSTAPETAQPAQVEVTEPAVEAGPNLGAYQNDGLGFRLNMPEGFEASQPTPEEVLLLGPGEGHPGETRAAVFIFAEAANERTAEQVVEALIADTGPGFNITTSPTGIAGETALVVDGLPGQDANRQLFIVHAGVLYKMMFVPNSPQAPAYPEMEAAYAALTGTFAFTK